jgi:hypothetical protein
MVLPALVVVGCGSNGFGGLDDGGDLPTGETGEAPLSPIGPIDLGLGGETQMAIAGNRVVVAWNALTVSRPGVRTDAIGYALSTDRGTTFMTTSTVREAPLGDPIAAATPDGSLFVGGLALCATGCVGRVAVARSQKDTTSFEPAVMIDNPHFVDHPWLTAASDGRLTVVYNPRDFTQNPPAFLGSGIQAATSKNGLAWETHDVVSFDANRNVAIATGSVDGTESFALFYDSDAPFGETLEKSANGAAWAPTTTFPETVTSYLGSAVRSASRGPDVWLLYGLAGSAASQTTSIVFAQGLALGHSSDGGATWQKPAIIVSDGRSYLLPELAIERNGALDVAYYAGNRDLDPDATFEWMRSTDAGTTWSSPVVLKRGILFQSRRDLQDWLGDYVAVASDDDYAYFAWTSNDTGQAVAQFARRPLPLTTDR